MCLFVRLFVVVCFVFVFVLFVLFVLFFSFFHHSTAVKALFSKTSPCEPMVTNTGHTQRREGSITYKNMVRMYVCMYEDGMNYLPMLHVVKTYRHAMNEVGR